MECIYIYIQKRKRELKKETNKFYKKMDANASRGLCKLNTQKQFFFLR